MASLEQARAAKGVLRRALAGNDGVTGIGLTRGAGGAGGTGGDAQSAPGTAESWLLQVNVVDAVAAGAVPPEVDGVAVAVRVTGRIEAG